jgi:ubiquinone/menaquinone biosynthesis C-methylase UbiE
VTPTRDRWASWLLERRYGACGSPEQSLNRLAAVRDRVLDGAQIREGEVVLDVGAGDGLIAFGALDRVGPGGHVVFTDVSQDLLDVAAALADEAGVRDRCTFLRAPAEALTPLADESVDVVTTRSVLIYVEEKRRAFEEFFRVLRPGGRVSSFEPINRFGSPEPEGRFMGLDAGPVWPLAKRVRDRYLQMTNGAERAMMDFDERDLLEYAVAAGFASANVLLDARIEHGAPLWGEADSAWDAIVSVAPNPNAPSLGEVFEAELTPEERDRLVGYLRPRYEGGETVIRTAVAYLQAFKR